MYKRQHLIAYGILIGYTFWCHYGERPNEHQSNADEFDEELMSEGEEVDVKPKERIEEREEKGRTRKNRGRTGRRTGRHGPCAGGRRFCSSGLREFEIERELDSANQRFGYRLHHQTKD